MLGKIIKGWIVAIFANPMVLFGIMLIVAALLFSFSSPFKSIQHFFGIETKESLHKDLEQEKKNVEVLEDVGKQDKKAIAILEGTGKNFQDVLDHKEESKTTIHKVATKIQNESDDSVTKISDNAEIPEPVKIELISKERLESVWKTYCTFNQDEECQELDLTIKPIEQGV